MRLKVATSSLAFYDIEFEVFVHVGSECFSPHAEVAEGGDGFSDLAHHCERRNEPSVTSDCSHLLLKKDSILWSCSNSAGSSASLPHRCTFTS